ncbi:hypothetical protein JCM8097_003805 [Rhodosporidiobolus ruineniae]
MNGAQTRRRSPKHHELPLSSSDEGRLPSSEEESSDIEQAQHRQYSQYGGRDRRDQHDRHSDLVRVERQPHLPSRSHSSASRHPSQLSGRRSYQIETDDEVHPPPTPLGLTPFPTRTSSVHSFHTAPSRPGSRTSAHDAEPAQKEGGVTWVLIVCLIVVAIATSLDNASYSCFLHCTHSLIFPLHSQTTVSQFLTYATSSLGDNSALGIVSTASAIATGIWRPLATKEADMIGLGPAFLISLALYCSGYVLIAVSHSLAVYALGAIIGGLGISALLTLPYMTVSVYATSLSSVPWLQSCLSYPALVTGWIGSFIVDLIIDKADWRWGYGTFCIATPACTVPLLLFFLFHRSPKKDKKPSSWRPSARKLAEKGRSAGRKARGAVSRDGHLHQLGVVSLGVLALALAGILMPLTLLGEASLTIKSPLFWVPIGVGILCAGLLVYLELHTNYPLFPLKVFKSRGALVCFFATLLNNFSFYLLLAYQYTFIQVMFPAWSPFVQGCFAFSEAFTMSAVHIVVTRPMGWFARKVDAARREGKLAGSWLLKVPMWSTCLAHGLRVAGVGLTVPLCVTAQLHDFIAFPDMLNPQWLLIFSQVLHGVGGGIAGVSTMQIAMKASPTKKDWSLLGALIWLMQDLGNAFGSATATLVWRSFLPRDLKSNLSSLLSSDEITAIVDSTTKATSYDEGSDISNGIRSSYAATMERLLLGALVVAALSFLASFFIGPVDFGDEGIPDAPAQEVREEMRAVEAEEVGAEREMGKRRRRRRGRREKGNEEEREYLNWARKPMREKGESESSEAEGDYV